MDTQTLLNIIGLIASISSLALAIVAIWLSFKFFEKSSEASEKTNEAAKGISSSVERLEKLFDKLYSDTFSVMKDTVSDMRKHLWSSGKDEPMEELNKVEEEAEKKAESKIAQIKDEISKEVIDILQRQKRDRQVTDEKIHFLQNELNKLMEKAISESRLADTVAKEETIRELILKRLRVFRIRKRIAKAEDFLSWSESEGLNPSKVFREIEKLAEEGIIELSDKGITGPEVTIRIK